MSESYTVSSEMEIDRLTSNLNFVICGHLPNFNIQNVSGDHRSHAAKMMELIFSGIKKGDFEFTHFERNILTLDEIEVFSKSGDDAFGKKFLENKLDVIDARKGKLRKQTYGILCVLNHAFENHDSNQVSKLRKILELNESHKNFANQKRTISLLRRDLGELIFHSNISSAVTYWPANRIPIIDTRKVGFLREDTAREIGRRIMGDYHVYRRVFIEKDEPIYIKENLLIWWHEQGMRSYLNSRKGFDDCEVAIYNGVVFFAEEQIWIMLHNPNVYTKMRTGLAHTNAWLDVSEGKKSSVNMLWQSLGVFEKKGKVVSTQSVVKRSKQKIDYEFDECKIMTVEDLRNELSENEVESVINGRLEA